jgi:hypothetical protein
MFTTEPAEEVKNIVDEYNGLITRATLLCREYIKMKGCDYGYSVYEVSISGDKIYFRYRHFDGVMHWGPPESIPLNYLSNEHWQTEARNVIEQNKKDGLRYSQLKSFYEEKYLVPEFVVNKYIEDIETGNGKAERLEYLKLKERFQNPVQHFMGQQTGLIHYKWNSK